MPSRSSRVHAGPVLPAAPACEDQQMAEQQMRNPFQSEADAFRVLVIIVLAALIVIAAAVLISQTVGAILAVIAIAAGLWKSFGWLRVALGEPEGEPEGTTPADRDDDAPTAP